MKRVAFAAAVVLLGTPAMAQSNAQACAKEPDPQKRLACYDAAAKQSPSPPAEPAAAAPSERAWEIKTGKSEMDDSPRAVASLESVTATGRAPTFLGLRCIERQLSAIVLLESYEVSERVQVMYRIDDKPPRTTIWGITQSHRGAGVFGEEARPFMAELAQAQRLVLRVNGRQTEQATYDLANVDEAVKAVVAACPPRAPRKPPTASKAERPGKGEYWLGAPDEVASGKTAARGRMMVPAR